MLKNIFIPKYVFKGIMHNEIAFPKRYTLFGADTETVRGLPYTFQVSGDGVHADIEFVNSENVLDKFLAYIEPRLLAGHVNVIYFHNLKFDLPVLLKQQQGMFAGKTKLEMTYKGAEFKFIIAKLYFGRIRFAKNKVLTVVDSFAFFVNYSKASLKYLAKELDLPSQKLDSMPDIGERKYKAGSADYKKFVEYSKQDAIVEWHLGAWIIEQFKKYNTRICVSSPQFSARVFKHYFLKSGDCIAFPPPQATRGSILSYHGGKNGYYAKVVTVIDKCYEIDVVSMYPYAMKSLPNFLTGKYFHVRKYTPEFQGVYCISGEIIPDTYPVIFSHDFSPMKGRVRNIWITSYELAEALRMNEVELTKCTGWLWRPDGKSVKNPFSDFVDFFFRLKDTAKTPSEKMLAKIILNSLYGKTIQTIEDDKDKTDFKADFTYDPNAHIFLENRVRNMFMASGMFNPFIATLITGFARAYLHRLEHKFKAIHSSTDSVKTTMIPVEDKRLGGIKIECCGKCIIFRNKLYLHYNAAGELKKYALHGFLGRPEKLKEMFDKKVNTYTTKHLYKVREALRQHKVPLDMAVVNRELLGVDFEKVTYI